MSLHCYDIYKFISEMGMTHVGTCHGRSDLYSAMETAIEEIERQWESIYKARRIVCWLSLSQDITLGAIDKTMEILFAKMHADAEILWDTRWSVDPAIDGVVLMTGAGHG